MFTVFFSIKTMNSTARVRSPMVVLSIFEGLGLSPALKQISH